MRFLVEKLIYRKLYKQCLIALTGIAFMVSSTQGMILCDGRDASISSKEATTFLKEVCSSSKAKCGPCVDTPIPVALAKISKKPYPVNPTPQVSTTIIPTTVASYDFTKYQFDSELSASVNPCLASLRTIILLT